MFFINIERLLLVIIIQGVPETCDSQGYTAWSVTYFCFCKSVLRNSIVPQCALDCCRFFGTPCILYYTLYSLKETLCSITEQCTTSYVLTVLEHSHIQSDVIRALFSDNARLSQWEIIDAMF